MLNNLRAEMVRRNISAKDIAKVLGIGDRAARDRLAGRVQFSIDEALAVRNNFFPELDIDYLFMRRDNSVDQAGPYR